MSEKSLFADAPDIIPVALKKGMRPDEFIQYIGQTCFEARNLFRGAELFKTMIEDNNTIWLGISGAGIAGGMGGVVISLIESGFIDIICSTGAQVYHDLHFAFDLPVKAVSPHVDDNALRQHGDTRIFDIGIREKETLERQDEILCQFIQESFYDLSDRNIASWEFNYLLGKWVIRNAPHPDRSFVAQAAEYGVPVFWDSHSNHSIAMNIMKMGHKGLAVTLSSQKDVFDSAALTYASKATGFIEMGGGGPKNFIQQTGPTVHQILGVEFEGADRGLQISTSVEREGSLSSCTFGEAVTWGKYQHDDQHNLVQIWGEYSIIFPLIAAYVLEQCESRQSKCVITKFPEYINKLETASESKK